MPQSCSFSNKWLIPYHLLYLWNLHSKHLRLKAYRCLVYEYNLKEFYPIFPPASNLVYLYCTDSVSQIPYRKSKEAQQVFRWRLLTSTAQPEVDGARLIQLNDAILTTSAVTDQLLMKPLGWADGRWIKLIRLVQLINKRVLFGGVGTQALFGS